MQGSARLITKEAFIAIILKSSRSDKYIKGTSEGTTPLKKSWNSLGVFLLEADVPPRLLSQDQLPLTFLKTLLQLWTSPELHSYQEPQIQTLHPVLPKGPKLNLDLSYSARALCLRYLADSPGSVAIRASAASSSSVTGRSSTKSRSRRSSRAHESPFCLS